MNVSMTGLKSPTRIADVAVGARRIARYERKRQSSSTQDRFASTLTIRSFEGC